MSVAPHQAADRRLSIDFLDELQQLFATEFSVWDGESGEMLSAANRLDPVCSTIADQVRWVARTGETRLVSEENGLVALLVRLPFDGPASPVAVGRFVADDGLSNRGMRPPKEHLVAGEVAAWGRGIDSLPRWRKEQLLSLAKATTGKWAAEKQSRRLQRRVDHLSSSSASAQEAARLLSTVTQHLRISRSDDELARLTIERLQDCIPAQSFVVQLLPEPGLSQTNVSHRWQPRLIGVGEHTFDNQAFSDLLERLQVTPQRGPYVNNQVRPRRTSQSPVQQLALAPIAADATHVGWLAAINHSHGGEFGSTEANLLASMAAILALHNSNRADVHEHSELVANVVRALVSAIDAKDPYTSGHSDRVARFAVRVALELRCGPQLVNTIYLAGLLHDVGKIGISDSVLRKAGRLTEAEFEHIKQHPELGCAILADLRQLADVLPAVRHHHERWDGLGYPDGLAGEEIPLIARIMAVADAYDAMTSDRPYRKGLPQERVDELLERGAARQWDPAAVAAFLAAKTDILAIAASSRPVSKPVEELYT